MRAHLRPLLVALGLATAASCGCGPDAGEPDAGWDAPDGGARDSGTPLLDGGAGAAVGQFATAAGRAASPSYALEFSVGASTQPPHRSQSPRYRLESAARLFTTESP